jgi:hypothetical protein
MAYPAQQQYMPPTQYQQMPTQMAYRSGAPPQQSGLRDSYINNTDVPLARAISASSSVYSDDEEDMPAPLHVTRNEKSETKNMKM